LGLRAFSSGAGYSNQVIRKRRAAAIVKAVTNYMDPKVLADVSEDLGEAMVGINESEIAVLMAERGK
jgi:pyridoxal phosphate synthase yaaD subunit